MNTHNNVRGKLGQVIGVTALLWMFLYIIFRGWTVWYSFTIDGRIIDRVVIVLFALAELFIITHGMGYIANSIRAVRGYRREEVNFLDNKHPKVDVVIPSLAEPPEVLRRTIIAAQHMDYPNFEIILMDDSKEESDARATKAVADQLGVTYFRRPAPRRGAKAGNLNAYIKKSKTKYFVVFDADHRPTRDFLKLLVPQMEQDDRLAFIQTPQFYSNLTHSVVSKAAQNVQSLFFETISEGKSVQNAMFICGTNVIVRTEVLKKFGGFTENFITEDFATSIKIYRDGLHGEYYNFVAAFGDGPETLGDYFKQQYRWAKGSIDVFFNHLRLLMLNSRMLTVRQNIEFLLSGSYYLMGFAWLTLIVVPPVYLLWSVPVYFAEPWFYFVAYVPYFVFSTLFYLQLLADRRYSYSDILKSQSLTIVTLPVFARAGIDSMLRRKSSFQVTRKGAVAKRNVIPWRKMYVQFGLVLLNAVAIGVGLWRIGTVEEPVAIAINMFWAAFHIFMILYLPALILLRRSSRSPSTAALELAARPIDTL
jgi:cellulose synthase (UDP-forming)